MTNINEIHLVSGGAGFLGSNLIRNLVLDPKIGYVICLDNFLTSSNKNIFDFINNKKFRLIEKSVLQKLDIKVDFIWHLACPPSPKFYYSNPIETSKVVYQGTLNLLELAKKKQRKIFVC